MVLAATFRTAPAHGPFVDLDAEEAWVQFPVSDVPGDHHVGVLENLHVPAMEMERKGRDEGGEWRRLGKERWG